MINTLFKIVDRINKHGGYAYLVGGCVRDQLLGRTPSDYDLVTDLRPDKLEEIFAYMNPNLVGKSFGVVLVEGIEIATFRKDVYSADTIHTKGADSVQFADTLEEDLSRRDFTINAISQHVYTMAGNLVFGKIVDPFGGREDLDMRVLKFVGNPTDRIKEDPCRLYRALRFMATIGCDMDLATLYNHREYAKLVAPERRRAEIMKVLARADNPSGFFALAQACDILSSIFVSLVRCVEVEGGQHHNESVFQHCLLACDAVSKKYPMIRLAALLHDVGKPKTFFRDAKGVHFHAHEVVGSKVVIKDLEALRFSNDEIEYVREMILSHMFFFTGETKDSAYRRLMSRVHVPVRDLLRLRIADRKGNLFKKNKHLITKAFRRTLQKIRKIEKEEACLKLKDLNISGKDLIEMGYDPGPFFKEALQACLEAVLEDPSRNKKDELKAIALELFCRKGGR